ncbi:MAG: hypothetical protein ACW98I_15185 [Candidatus Hodarchaeales archaeon]|jgi:hypothetical protein
MVLPDPSQDVIAIEEVEPKQLQAKTSWRGKILQKFKVKESTHEELLEGKTLQIYWYLLTHPHGIAGIREIQKELGISSSGTVAYQINKLMSNDIISKNEQTEKYYVKEEIKSGIFGFYVRIGYRMIPRFSLYLTTYLLGFGIYFLLLLVRGDDFIAEPTSWVLLFFLMFGAGAFIFESIKMWGMKPN